MHYYIFDEIKLIHGRRHKMSTFPDVKKKLGFGCMRLPMDGEKVDYAEFTKMVDEFMAQGSTISTPHASTSAVRARRRYATVS